jgi:hypothetical protein
MSNPSVTWAIKPATIKLGGAAICLAGLLVLSACDERPYPTAESPPPPPPPTAELMGAPEAPPPPTAEVPPASADAPQPYDQGSVVAMAPIPNPGDPGSEPYYASPDDDHRVHARYYAAGPAPYGLRRSARRRAYAYAPTSQATGVQSTGPASLMSDQAPTVSVHHHVGAAAAGLRLPHAAKPSTAATATTKTAAAPADQAAALASLQTALSDAVAKTAVLTAPAHFTVAQPAQVTLAIPAGFADTVHKEAQKDGLGDLAASVNMTALLSGDGYTVLPADTQSGPLAAGQPTTFAWTVTAHPQARGPLHADVGADLLGGGVQKLTLGSVQPAGAQSSIGARAFGVVLLVLLAGVALIWASTRRGKPTVVRERPGGRPLNMAVDD